MVRKYDQSCKFDGDLVAETQTRFTPRTMRSALALVWQTLRRTPSRSATFILTSWAVREPP